MSIKILIDFDDTIWSRNYLVNSDELDISIDNINLINRFNPDTISIVSGNSYKNILEKLDKYGLKLNCDIWADANSKLYNNRNLIKIEDSFVINDLNKIVDILNNLHYTYEIIGDSKVTNIKIRPIYGVFRDTAYYELNRKFSEHNCPCTAVRAGKSTIDILSRNNSKAGLYKYYQDFDTLYIGDEIDSGNDSEIAYLCDNYKSVRSVKETNLILKELL